MLIPDRRRLLARILLAVVSALSFANSVESAQPQRPPISLGVLVDADEKIAPMLEMTHAGFNAFLTTLLPDDEIFVMAFNQNIADLADFTKDKNVISRAFGRFLTTRESRLYPTLEAAFKKLQEKGVNERKLVLVISSGQIESSDYARISSLLGKYKMVVHTIGVIPSCGPCEVQPKNIAKYSGGTYGGITSMGGQRYSIGPAFQALAETILNMK